ncbi:uncharacterized protein H6S33_005038 [Morchella sextelata]|uniref:uncharacterized protein n=1 Tax=Morchella sextelata TaxID=1174677 RepID=UPI001D04EFD2|nr:uncharacterized protein H6S33_005038 [Morchella sextelata]KAH0605056.1 hypothetical protein H6S33_005038 [Morchella sextelata]
MRWLEVGRSRRSELDTPSLLSLLGWVDSIGAPRSVGRGSEGKEGRACVVDTCLSFLFLCFAACGNGDESCAKMSVVRAEETVSTYRVLSRLSYSLTSFHNPSLALPSLEYSSPQPLGQPPGRKGSVCPRATAFRGR